MPHSSSLHRPRRRWPFLCLLLALTFLLRSPPPRKTISTADADGVAAVLTYSARRRLRLLLRHLHRFRALRLRPLDLILAGESPLHRRTRGQHLASCRT